MPKVLPAGEQGAKVGCLMLDARKMVKRLSGYQEIRMQIIRIAGYQVKEKRAEGREKGNIESFDRAQDRYRTRNVE